MRNREGGRSLRLCGAVVACCVLVTGRPALAVSSAPHLDNPLQACVERLREASLEEQRLCLQTLAQAGPAAADAMPVLVDLLARSDGATPHLLVAAVLDVLRSLGPRAAPATEILSGLLPHRSRLYQGRDKLLVIRLRAYLVVTLSEIGFPSSALPALLDTLAHLDERTPPLEIGAAARAAGSLGPPGCALAPYLLDALALRNSAEELSLERFEPQFPPHEATTVQLEAVRSLGRACSAQDLQVLAALRQLAEDDGKGELDPRVAQGARSALRLILPRQRGER